jgi:sulfur-oxidizing protein SoxY
MRRSENKTIDVARRKVLKTGGGLGLLGVFTALGLTSLPAWAGVKRAAFEAKSLGEALDAMGGIVPLESAKIILTAPEIAENGAEVSITVESMFPRTEQISILVDKNPTALAANFTFPQGTEGYISTRIKMAQTSKLVVLVKAEGKYYRVSREVKVTGGGC